MKSFKSYKTFVYSILVLFILSSCSNDLESEAFENSLVNVKLKGSQSDLSQMKLDILDVQFRLLEDATDPNAWVSLNTINTGVHDLMGMSQDETIQLVDFEELPAGTIYNIKIVYGDQNTATINGIEHTLDFSSEFENATINIIEKQLQANTIYEFIVEFEIDNSVEINANGYVDFTPKMNTLMRRMEIR